MKSMIALSQNFALLFSFAFAPRFLDLNYAYVAQIGREERCDVNSRQIQIDSFHLPSHPAVADR